MNRLLNILLSLVALAAFASDPAKSDYYFMEALRQEALDHQDASVALMRRAYELNPDPGSVPAKMVAFARISLAGADSIRFNQGVAMAKKYVDANPADHYAAVSLADIYARCGKPDLAEPLYGRAYAQHPEVASLGLRYAQTLAATEQTDSALAVLQAVERINGTNPMLAYPICHILLMEKQDTLGALAQVDKLLAAMPTDPDAVALATATYQKVNQPERALAILNKCIEQDPAEVGLHSYRLYIASRQGDVDGVGRSLLSSVESEDLGQSEVEQVLGYFASEICGRDSIWFPAMLQGAEAAERRFPQSAVPHLLRLHVSEVKKEYPDAVGWLRKALALAPARSDLWARLVLLMIAQNDLSGAIAAGRNGLQHSDGDDADLRLVLTGAMVTDGDFKAAAEIIRPLAFDETIEPDERAEYLCTLADCLQNFEPADSAAILYEKAIELSPSNILAKNNYAYMIAEYGGDLDLAERLIREVMEVEPGNPTYIDTAAWVAYKKGNYSLAKVYIDEAILMDSTGSEELQKHADAINQMLKE